VRRDRPFLAADPADAIVRVRDGDCIAGLSHATDGRAWRAGMHPLVDDLRFFPAFVPAPVVRTATLEAMPDLGPALRPLVDGLSTGLLGRANGAVLGVPASSRWRRTSSSGSGPRPPDIASGAPERSSATPLTGVPAGP
jgi:glycine betaine/choline ABC-type transport system substrate-binding protein